MVDAILVDVVREFRAEKDETKTHGVTVRKQTSASLLVSL
jgi:hypothetical protein